MDHDEISRCIAQVHHGLLVVEEIVLEQRFRSEQLQILLEALYGELRQLYDLTHVHETRSGISGSTFRDAERGH